jgi:hypothetical protein
MTIYLPSNFPVYLILELLEDLPLKLIKKHCIAVDAWKDVCEMILGNQGTIQIVAKKAYL